MVTPMSYKPFSLTHVTYPPSDPLAPLFALLSLTPPFVVCALSCATAIYHDVTAAFLLSGLLVTAGICAVTKTIIRQPRPVRDFIDDGEYGMPSNHSAFGWFGAVFVVLYIVRGGNAWARTSPSSLVTSGQANTNKLNACFKNYRWGVMVKAWLFVHTQLVVVAVVAIASGCSYSRVYLGYHTTNQVLAGSVLGCILGTIWYKLFQMKCVQRTLMWVDGVLVELEKCRLSDLALINDSEKSD